jgi:hypothetical protein
LMMHMVEISDHKQQTSSKELAKEKQGDLTNLASATL